MVRQNPKAQTVIELAVFGAILIFVLGVIVRQTLSFSYIQNQNLKAMRVALSTSYKYSEGIADTAPANDQNGAGVSSRNNASILLIEDRLTADSAKYGSIDRNPYINSAAGTFSRNLFLPVDPWENYNLPMMDVMVNGIQFPFSTAAFRSISRLKTDPATGLPIYDSEGKPIPVDKYYKVVPNHPLIEEWCNGDGEAGTTIPCTVNLKAAQRFDLKRCGLGLDRGDKPDCADPVIVPVDQRHDFVWQWYEVPAKYVEEKDPKEKQEKSVDIDGDLKIENIIDVDLDQNMIIYIDGQEGDMDLSAGDHENKPSPGLKDSVQMFTKTKDGTYLTVREGRLFDAQNQFVRTASRKDSIDIVQRVIQLSNDTGRFCQNGAPTPNEVSTPIGIVWTKDAHNPVEACGACFSNVNIDKICFDSSVTPPVIYVRSRVLDRHGRSWVTDKSTDTYINFSPSGR
jgi:hypothetical protein